MISRKVWGEQVVKISAVCKERAKQRKKNKSLPELKPVELSPGDLIHNVADFWGLAEYSLQIRAIQQINDTLKVNKLKGNTGGVPYEWYYLAAKYLKRHPGIEDLRQTCEQMIDYIASLIEPIAAQYPL